MDTPRPYKFIMIGHNEMIYLFDSHLSPCSYQLTVPHSDRSLPATHPHPPHATKSAGTTCLRSPDHPLRSLDGVPGILDDQYRLVGSGVPQCLAYRLVTGHVASW